MTLHFMPGIGWMLLSRISEPIRITEDGVELLTHTGKLLEKKEQGTCVSEGR